jgi:glycosyltransferase involved in cell wall biosynthesis
LLEGFGLPVIEAMKFGKPVFLSKHTSLPEIGGSSAYYWEYFEPKYMAEMFNSIMQKFLSDTQKAKNIKLYAEKFSWDIATKQYIELYLEILNKK